MALYHPEIAKRTGFWWLKWHGTDLRIIKIEASTLVEALTRNGVQWEIETTCFKTGTVGHSINLTNHDDECMEVWLK